MSTYDFEIAIIGAGFGGLAAALRLKKEGQHSFVILERATEIGGTWRDNIYPGCGCDIPSHLYSFADELNPNWSRSFSGQAEILAYLKHCVNKNNLQPHIQFGFEVNKAIFDETSGTWQLSSSDGQTLSARVVVSATGPLNRPNIPKIEGLENFEGKVFHTSAWDTNFSLKGKKVAIIGTGASAIQVVPNIVNEVAELSIFQRTAPWIVPRLDRKISHFEHRLFETFPFIQRGIRSLIYWILELRGMSFLGNKFLNKLGTLQALRYIKNQIKNPELRRKVTPNYQLGCKRVLISDDYYKAIQQPHVRVEVDGIKAIEKNGLRCQNGELYEADLIVLGTGFVASEILLDTQIIGRNGRNLIEEWKTEGPEAYRGINVAGFPNTFFLLGPNTGLGHNSVVHIMESQVNYLMDFLNKMKELPQSAYFDVKPSAQQENNRLIQQKLKGTVWDSGCKSWYQTSEGKNTTIYPGLTVTYRNETRHFQEQDYDLILPKTNTNH